MKGILNILKPPAMTSQDVVSYVKRLVKADKAGHTGTLDPNAAGVLPVCLGKATRVTEYLLNDKKSYRAELMIGALSNTLDKYGEVEFLSHELNSHEKIYEALLSFKGNIKQIPPMFSALKHNGRRLYELARQGEEVERKVREVFIYDLSLINIEGNRVIFDVTCSKGTYIRTLCSDIGKYLGSDAIMTFLLRTKTGPFDIKDAITLDELKCAVENDNVKSYLHGTDKALEEYSRVYIDDELSKRVLNGVGFNFDECNTFEKRNYDDVILIYNNENFLALGRRNDINDFVKIDKVFA
ncbi:tRNA pseudouridine synthase B [Oxobacter pfennigii]|uniref:tRNA pseudouridine synthase B n=1 Tax=Oxobacter pfennigii TaxID=36849 RepID=A0A0P8WZJ0_9CLOT|nr:tRNA pseudouridine(55) synthase TruB [Oxobacter pfennigii]KPU43899.1 tRNA pseudouridine synthase B [Oxobacter pfennigii]